MNCEHCEYQFNIYKFAYRQMRRCPECGQMYEMHFPTGTGFIPFIAAIIITIVMTYQNRYTFLVIASIFILLYYIIDIIFKISMIYTDHYEITEMNR
ncbi:MAG: hypothetical protein ACK5LC_03700 [Coprobacillaceae bacterium]